MSLVNNRDERYLASRIVSSLWNENLFRGHLEDGAMILLECLMGWNHARVRAGQCRSCVVGVSDKRTEGCQVIRG